MIGFDRVAPAGLKLIAAVMLLLVAAWPGASHATAKIEKLVTPGGITVWFVQDATVPVVSVQYAFEGGANQDPADKPGVATLVASLLDEGAGDLDSKAFRERLDNRAIDLNFNATRDHFRGNLRMMKDDRDEAFGLLRLALTSPRFDKDDIERMRAQIMSGLRRQTTDPGSLASLKLLAMEFGDHPYGRPVNGTLESVPTITVDDLRGYTRRVLARDTLKIAVVGDIDAASLARLVDQTFGTLPAQSDLTPVAEVKAAPPPQRSFIPLDVPQTVVAYGGPGVKRDDPDFMAAYVVNHILGGGGLTSRLYTEVREKRGLAYSVSQYLSWMAHSALFIGTTATRADRANETVEVIGREVQRMANEGPTQQELDEAKSYLKGSQMLALDTSTKLASGLLQYQIDNLGIDYIEKRNAMIDAVTLDDARRVAKRLWGQGLVTVVVGRAAQAAAQPAAVTAPKAN